MQDDSVLHVVISTLVQGFLDGGQCWVPVVGVQQGNVGLKASSEGSRLKPEDSLQWPIPFQFTRSNGPFPRASVCSLSRARAARALSIADTAILRKLRRLHPLILIASGLDAGGCLLR